MCIPSPAPRTLEVLLSAIVFSHHLSRGRVRVAVFKTRLPAWSPSRLPSPQPGLRLRSSSLLGDSAAAHWRLSVHLASAVGGSHESAR